MGDSVVFTYGAPFVGVLLVAVGIGAAVPAAYGVLQDDATCGDPTISVESPDRTADRFGDDPPSGVARFELRDLSPAERAAVEEARDDAVGEAEVTGEFPHAPEFRNGSLVTVDGQHHYVTVVAENPCYGTDPLQLPLGVFSVALGVVGILTPPAYRKLAELEASLRE